MTSPTSTPSIRKVNLGTPRSLVSWAVIALSVAVALSATYGLWIDRSSGADSEATVADQDPFDLVDWIGPPASLQELLRESQIVVVGKFVSVNDLVTVFPTGYDPSHLPAGQSAGVTFTNLTFQVDEYLRGSGPKSVIVTQTGDLKSTSGLSAFPKPALGQEQVLFLTREEAREGDVWASNRGPFGRMVEKNGRLEFPTVMRPQVEFLVARSIAQLKQEIKAQP